MVKKISNILYDYYGAIKAKFDMFLLSGQYSQEKYKSEFGLFLLAQFHIHHIHL